MTLSKREQNIAIGLGATVALVVLLEVLVFPYFDALKAIDDGYSDAVKKQAENISVFERRTKLKKVWTEITNGGLTSDESKAESQALSAVSDWAQATGVTITQQKTERATDALPFQIIRFRVTGIGSTPGIAKFLYSMETAAIPVHLEDMTITPRKVGTDDLQIELSLSTLCLKPDQEMDNKNTVAQADGQVEP